MINAFTRSILFWVLFVALLYGTSSLAYLAPPEWARLIHSWLGILCAFLITWLFLKNEKRSFSDIGLIWKRATIFRFLLGILTGTVIIALVLLVLLNFTELQLQKQPNAIQTTTWIGYLAVIIPLALMEEVAFRSYAFLKLNKAYGIWIAQFVAAIAFALYHIVSGWNVYVALLGPGIWAFVFGFAAMRSGGIALPTGIHVALNSLQVLTGMKTDKASMWVLKFKEGTSETLMARADTIGLVIQLTVLAVALVSTALFIQKNQDKLKGYPA